jgi:hypothetical protein
MYQQSKWHHQKCNLDHHPMHQHHKKRTVGQRYVAVHTDLAHSTYTRDKQLAGELEQHCVQHKNGAVDDHDHDGEYHQRIIGPGVHVHVIALSATKAFGCSACCVIH